MCSVSHRFLCSCVLGCPGTHGALLCHLSLGSCGFCRWNEVHPPRSSLVHQVPVGSERRGLFSLCWLALLSHCVLDHPRGHPGFLRPLPSQWDEVRDWSGCVSWLRLSLPQSVGRTGSVLERHWQQVSGSSAQEEEESAAVTSASLQQPVSPCSALPTPGRSEVQSRSLTLLCLQQRLPAQ